MAKDKCDSKFEFMPGVLVTCTKDADHVKAKDAATKFHGCGLGGGASLSWNDDDAYTGDGSDKNIVDDVMEYLRSQGGAKVSTIN